MRRFRIFIHFFLLLILAQRALALWTASPDWSSLAGANSGLSLDNDYNSTNAVDGYATITLVPPFSQTLLLSASVDIAGLSSTLDGSACPASGLSVLVARGISDEHLHPPEAADVNCTAGTAGQSDPRCDLDGDSCIEYENSTSVDYSQMSVDFIFGNSSVLVPFQSTAIPVPDQILALMQNSSGADNLTVRVSGDARISIQVIDPTFAGGTCSDSVRTFNSTIILSQNRTFGVYGQNKIVFLSARSSGSSGRRTTSSMS